VRGINKMKFKKKKNATDVAEAVASSIAVQFFFFFLGVYGLDFSDDRKIAQIYL